MSKSNLSLEHAYEVIKRAENLVSALILLQNQELESGDFNSISLSLLERLVSDLQGASIVVLVNTKKYQGGMGEAPMFDALKPSSC
ncbi:hypothetical protein [Shewanella oncorhynchi]|uniref:hypothetical protein n=1 Tax=Shewanella oncorhynchi TaxID=2726434 RepID=UPI003D78E224